MRIFIAIFFSILSHKPAAQLTKGNWLVGGNFNLSIGDYKSSTDTKETEIRITPKAGYFLKDKLAAGLMANFDYRRAEISSNVTSGTLFYIGPLIRYYFFSVDKIANLLIEPSYLFGFSNQSPNRNNFSISAGPVVFLNNVVGLEFLIGYTYQKFSGLEDSNRFITTSIGLQIHLERDK